MTGALVSAYPAIAWVAAARSRDVTRRHLQWLQVSADGDDFRLLTALDGRRLHQARLPTYRLPAGMTPGLYDVLSARAARETTLRRRADSADWVNWRKLIPDWDAAGDPIGFLPFYHPRARCGAEIGWLLRDYAAITGGALNVDLLRDLWIRGVTFEARARDGLTELVLRHELGRERLTALVMPLLRAGIYRPEKNRMVTDA